MTIYANLLGRFQMRVLEDTFTEEKKKWDESRKAVLKLLEMLCSTWNSCKRPKGHNTTQHECLWKAWEKWKKSWQKTKISKGIVHTRLYNIIILIRWKWALTYLNNYQDYLILLRKKKSKVSDTLRLLFFFRAKPAAHGNSQARVEPELQLLAYTTTPAMRDPSYVCKLHHSSWQCQIPNPLSEARDQTRIFMVTSWVH